MSPVRPHPAWASTSFTLAELVSAMDVPVDPLGLQAELVSLPTEHGGILGAQLLGQMVSSCEAVTVGKVVSTMRMTFLRPSIWDQPAHVRLRRLSDGRRYGALEVDITQAGRLVARGEALLEAPSHEQRPDDDACRASEGLPPSTTADARALWPWEVRVGPAGHDVVPGTSGIELWARVPDVVPGSTLGRALLAFATESLTIPLAIDVEGRRSDGGRLPQPVLSHSITFVTRAAIGRWHRHEAEVVSRTGETVVGRGRVLDQRGTCLATTETIATVNI